MYLITIILLIGKVFANLNISWFECFTPLIIATVFWVLVIIIGAIS